MSNCKFCAAEIRFDYERPANGKPYTIMDVSREAPHDVFCRRQSVKPKPQPILIAIDHVVEAGKRYNLGFFADLREDKIAALIVAEAMRCGLDPASVRTERRGDFLILKQ